MRKTIVVCLCLLLAVLSSCGKLPPKPERESPVPDSIMGTYSVQCDGFSFTAEIEAFRGNAKIVFREPETLAGYEITCNDSEFVFDMCGITSVRSARESPKSSVACMLYAVLRSGLSGSGKFRMNGSDREYETSGAVLLLDDSGTVISFSDHNGKIKAEKI